MEDASLLVQVHVGDIVMLPRYAPYPRFGHVADQDASGHVRLDRVYCGDPRCAAEHQHREEVWPLADIRATRAYQPRANWERGRKSSPNAPLD